MTDDFVAALPVLLRPGAAAVPVAWTFRPATAGNNDGSIPYGSTLAGAAVSVYDSLGADQTASVLVANSVVAAGFVVSAALNHPGTVTGTGRYTAVVTLTLSTGAVIPFDSREIVADAVVG